MVKNISKALSDPRVIAKHRLITDLRLAGWTEFTLERMTKDLWKLIEEIENEPTTKIAPFRPYGVWQGLVKLFL